MKTGDRNPMRQIEHVPTYYPTLEDLENPLEYFQTLRNEGEKFGILRVVTPEEWRPQTLPQVSEPFESYRQEISNLRNGPTFADGDQYTIEEYRKYATELSKTWIQQNPDLQPDPSLDKESAEKYFTEAVEEIYWKLVEGESGQTVVLDYASDQPLLNTESEWCLNSLIEEEGNVLQHLDNEIPGVTSPWVYFGCLFSTFCWHVEDHFMSSVNYLHDGSAKIWYGIPARRADDFEDRLSACATTRSMRSDILSRLTIMLSPFSLPDDYPVFKAVQRPGDLILTFPRAFHGGFNEGWNCASAVNFATMEWVMTGQIAAKRLKSIEGKKALFSHDRLLWILIAEEIEKHSSVQLIPSILKEAVTDACEKELSERRNLRGYQLDFVELIPENCWPMVLPSWTCATCDYPLFFSYCTCICKSKMERVIEVRISAVKTEVLCIKHALESDAFKCGCRPFLCLERSDKELEEMIAFVNMQEQETLEDNHQAMDTSPDQAQ